jgi:hypothetical protein
MLDVLKQRLFNAEWKQYLQASEAPYLSNTRLAFTDGLFGGSLSEFGYEPGPKRLLKYATGCAVAGREVPLGALSRVGPDSIEELYMSGDELAGPARVAAAVGDAAGLLDFPLQLLQYDLEYITGVAAYYQQVEVLKALQSVGADFSDFDGRRINRQILWEALRNGKHKPAMFLLEDCKMKRLSERVGMPLLTEMAAEENNLQALKLLHSKGRDLGREVLAHACAHSNHEMFDWARSKGLTFVGTELPASLKAGNLALHAMLISQGCPRSKDELSAACLGFRGDTHALEKVVQSGAPVSSASLESLAHQAIQSAFPHVLRWMASLGSFKGLASAWDADCLQSFVKEGKDDITERLQWLSELPSFRGWKEEADLYKYAVAAAVKHGHETCLNWLLDPVRTHLSIRGGERPRFGKYSPLRFEGQPPKPSVLKQLQPYFDLTEFYPLAIERSDVQVIRWLSTQGYKVPLKESTCPILQLLDHERQGLPILKVLVEECGVILADVRAVSGAFSVSQAAARSGGLQALQYAFSQLCEFDSSLLLHAACTNQVNMLRWLRAKQPSWEWPEGLVDEARRAGAFEAAAYAVEQGAADSSPALSRYCLFNWNRVGRTPDNDYHPDDE